VFFIGFFKREKPRILDTGGKKAFSDVKSLVAPVPF
jgi:hypothetical protein